MCLCVCLWVFVCGFACFPSSGVGLLGYGVLYLLVLLFLVPAVQSRRTGTVEEREKTGLRGGGRVPKVHGQYAVLVFIRSFRPDYNVHVPTFFSVRVLTVVSKQTRPPASREGLVTHAPCCQRRLSHQGVVAAGLLCALGY